MAMRCTITMAAALVVEAALLNGLLHGSQHCLLVALTAHGELASGMRALDVVHALALWKSIHRGKDLLLTITAVHSFDVNLQLSVATVALGVAVIVRHGFGVVRRVARSAPSAPVQAAAVLMPYSFYLPTSQVSTNETTKVKKTPVALTDGSRAYKNGSH